MRHRASPGVIRSGGAFGGEGGSQGEPRDADRQHTTGRDTGKWVSGLRSAQRDAANYWVASRAVVQRFPGQRPFVSG